jgi:hypothetical protein
MSQRASPPTEDIGTATLESNRVRARFDAAPPAPPRSSSEPVDAFEGDATEENPRQGLATVEQPTPTEIDPSVPSPPAAPVRVISMKKHAEGRRAIPEHRVPLHVQLRTLAEVAGHHELQPGLGHLAPPRELAQAPACPVRGIAIRVGIAVALGFAAALVIWFLVG